MVSIPNNPFILVDGSSYLFRAYYALPPLTNSEGEPTGAILGVCNMLRKLLTDYNPEKIAVVFDTKGKTFRHEMFSEYKANRTDMPEDLAAQIPTLFELIEVMGLPLITVPGVEADDVIGTLAKQAEKQELFTLISTGDKDLAQLVTKNILLINTMSDTILDEAGVMDKFGIPPELIIDFLSLTGDTSDNIPGIPKVGPKTAIKWLQEYKNLPGIITNAASIKGKVGDNLRDNLQELKLYKNLVTIDTDVELPLEISELNTKPVITNKLSTILKKLNFNRWLAEVKTDKMESPQTNRSLILEKKDFTELVQKLDSSDAFAIDTETTSLNTIDAKLVGISIACNDDSAYIPVGHNYDAVPKQLDKKWVLDKLKYLLVDNTRKKIAHNLKYDMQILNNEGIDEINNVYDTMLESYVLNSTSNRHDMDTLADKYLDTNTIKYEDVAGNGAKQVTFDQVPLDKAYPYAAEDAEITLKLHNYLYNELKSDEKLYNVFSDIDMPLVSVLASMETKGVLTDAKLLEEISNDIEKRLEQLQKQAFGIADEEFNMNSPKQLQEILYDKLKLPVLQKTPKGQASTAENVLHDLSNEYELPKVILEYRSLSKLKSTYTDKLPLQINTKTNRVHTSYHQAVTATGRLSSSEPNLQNIPIRTDMGRKIRKAFIADEGYVLLAADYSQIELRILAHLADDPTLITAFKNSEDIHALTASEVFGTTKDKVTQEQRRQAKAINFGLMYGMSGFGLSKQLKISVEEASEYINTYFSRFPKVSEFIETTKENAANKGYVETIYGRRLYLPDINSKNHIKRKAAQRAAINAPMQGGQSDIIKKAMIAIHEYLKTNHPDTHMIMQVHDELVFEVPETKIDFIKTHVSDTMTNIIKLNVNLEVSSGIGKSWDEAH